MAQLTSTAGREQAHARDRPLLRTEPLLLYSLLGGTARRTFCTGPPSRDATIP